VALLAAVALLAGVLMLVDDANPSSAVAGESAQAASVDGRPPVWRRPPGSGLRGKRMRLPPPAAKADYELGGAYPPPAGVAIVGRDRTDPPAQGIYGICYVNAFQTQPDERPWWRANHSELLLKQGGREVIDPGWPDEVLLDTSTAAKRTAIAAIVGGWIDGCATSGYAARAVCSSRTSSLVFFCAIASPARCAREVRRVHSRLRRAGRRSPAAPAGWGRVHPVGAGQLAISR